MTDKGIQYWWILLVLQVISVLWWFLWHWFPSAGPPPPQGCVQKKKKKKKSYATVLFHAGFAEKIQHFAQCTPDGGTICLLWPDLSIAVGLRRFSSSCSREIGWVGVVLEVGWWSHDNCARPMVNHLCLWDPTMMLSKGLKSFLFTKGTLIHAHSLIC